MKKGNFAMMKCFAENGNAPVAVDDRSGHSRCVRAFFARS